ncbi:MAG TPA: hypothetical protein VGG38_11805 [Acidimicrobiales bacterium]|jgi:hypothetical protein
MVFLGTTIFAPSNLPAATSTTGPDLADYSASAGAVPSSALVTSPVVVSPDTTINPVSTGSGAQGDDVTAPTAPTSEQTAVSAASATGIEGINSSTIQPTVLYGDVLNTVMGPLVSGVPVPSGVTVPSTPAASWKPTYDNTPMWIVEYQGIQAPLASGHFYFTSNGTLTTNPPPIATNQTTTLYVFVNAQTGDYAFAEE